MKQLISAINRWFGKSVGNAFGNPLEERQHQPPNVGVQPSGIHRPTSTRAQSCGR